MKKELKGTLGEINDFVEGIENAMATYKDAIKDLPRDTKKIQEEFKKAIEGIPSNAMDRTMEQVEVYQKAFDKKMEAEKNAALDTKRFTEEQKKLHENALKALKSVAKEAEKSRKEHGDILQLASKKIKEDELIGGKQHAANMETIGEKQVEGEETRTQIILDLQKRLGKGLKEVDQVLAKDDSTEAYKKKWKGIADKTKDYTDQVNNSLTSMFGATTKYLEKEKELMTKELAAINEKLEGAKKETAKAAQEFANVKAKAQEEIDKEFALKHTDTDEEKDRKEAEREAAYAEIEELQALYDKRQEMADDNAKHEGEIDYQAQQLSVEEVNRFNELSTAHKGYVASLDQKMKAQKDAQKEEGDLQNDATDKQAEIDKKEKQKQRVEMSQQMIAASVNIAQGITKALAMGPILGPIMAGVVGAAGAVQIGMMSAQMAKMRLEDGGLLSGKRHSAGGMRIQGSNIEVEGGEYVVNRQSTDKNLGLIRYINSQRRQLAPSDLDSFFAKSSQGFEPPFRQAFAQGGQLPNIEPTTNIDNQLLVQAIQGIKFEPKVSVTDINTVQSDIVKVDAWTGM